MTNTPLTDQQLADRIVAAVSHGLRFAEADPDSVLPEIVNAVLAVVHPELDRVASRRGLYRAAWMSARNRAAGYQQRYRYERRLCDSADLRATQAIRGQLAVEQQRDELAAELGRVRSELADAQAERGQLHSTLLHFAAEAHRRKWSHGTGDEGPTSPAFAELHRIGTEMAAAEHAVRHPAAAVPSA